MVLRVIIYLLIFVLVSCCARRRSTGTSGIFSGPRPLAQLKEKRLSEVSGLAASAVNPGLLWTQNDSGNPAEVYLVDEKLQIRLSCSLHGGRNQDWEDIAVGPGPARGKSYVYVADIGDNNSSHGLKHLYRFEEPKVSSAQTSTTITKFDTIVFRLEDGKKDTEAIMIDPETGEIYVISKREKPVYVYRLNGSTSSTDTLVARKMIPLPLTQIVSAGISPDGTEIIMKNYDHIYYWERKGRPVLETLRQEPQMLRYREEPQGEAIAFNREGSGFYTLSEKLFGEKVFLYFYQKTR
jgi:hypothetical protein